MAEPVLIGCVWAGADPEAMPVAAQLVEAAASALGGVDGLVAVAGQEDSSLVDVLLRLSPEQAASAVIVPLSLGYAIELTHAIAATVEATGRGRTAETLAPDIRLVEVVLDRLKQAHVDPEATLVLAVEGSLDPLTRADATAAAEALRLAWRGPVRIGSVAEAEASVAAAVDAARIYGEEGQVAIASFLLWPGARQRALGAAGAGSVTEQLAPHPAVVAIVIDRYSEVARA